ncbi:sodium-translocating pyrophosphatase [candidate division WOR-3 bacterium]|uniref:Putative K(+)-stimulated pyrophosphate-energized sodium pump n=1 Tax=candidate division WOR-3 bacterium TaxID=2052148 RepID=A0A9D5KBG9_UNCW3|nr:sodium-translocating pyrophosphatase [candidate division WOR-3 bacterium]MBD3364701.1 sodium-translocating pyrophosphatase [candidate division WOR-3 bacterium]
MQWLYWFAPAGALLALGFAVLLVIGILRRKEGTPAMISIAKAVREGATAYIRRQYSVVSVFFGIIFLVLLALAFLNLVPLPVPFAFITGGFFSGLSGFLGLKVATASSARTANAARESLNSGLRVGISSGMVMGLVVVGLAVLDLSIWFGLLTRVFSFSLQDVTLTMVNFGMGASFYALFARVGGGIFTKAADVGADLVGKVEAGIPEDDRRNPATIADNVGDNVGDVAGMGADLYESYYASIIASMALAMSAGFGFRGVLLPLLIASLGIASSIIGYFVIRSKNDASQISLLWAIRRGTWGAAFLTALGAFFIIWFLLGPRHIGIYFSLLTGLAAGVLLGFLTEYFTSSNYRPTRRISESAETGPATVIIEGLSVGMISAAPSVLVVATAVLGAFFFAGGSIDISNSAGFNMGLYGVGIAAVGMLSTLGITLATDAYGPVADNAGGNAQMAKLKPIVRRRTDALDSLGNTTAATGKGFAIGSAALTALALLVVFKNKAEQAIISAGKLVREIDISLTNPRLLIGIFLGAVLVFLISALIMRAIGTSAQAIVKDVRRQFKAVKGIMQGKVKPDYAGTVDLCTKSAQKQMIIPALSAIVSPVLVGIVLGIEGVLGLLAGAITTGFAMAIFMANSGGAWDNAKKYIETGNCGGIGSDAHKAGVVGDTVGDPFKDAAGPALNILIKLMSMVSIVFLGLVVALKLF